MGLPGLEPELDSTRCIGVHRGFCGPLKHLKYSLPSLMCRMQHQLTRSVSGVFAAASCGIGPGTTIPIVRKYLDLFIEYS